jgi:hypothetical protein
MSTAEDCGQCHVRGDPLVIPASGGFIRRHEQYNELLASPHAALDCIDWHDSHKKAEFSIETGCVDCHEDFADGKSRFKKLGTKHLEAGLSCQDCHMPYAAKSAVAENEYTGDIRSHLFGITTDKNINMFNEAGTEATGVLVGEYVCLGCHEDMRRKYEVKDEKAMQKGKPLPSINWARKSTKKIHKG